MTTALQRHAGGVADQARPGRSAGARGFAPLKKQVHTGCTRAVSQLKALAVSVCMQSA